MTNCKYCEKPCIEGMILCLKHAQLTIDEEIKKYERKKLKYPKIAVKRKKIKVNLYE
mgnify:CR=1 FL=1